MNILELCHRYLSENGIQFAHSIHPAAYTAREIASATCIPATDLAKVVIYHGRNGYGMLVLPADEIVDGDRLNHLLGLSHVRLATEHELAQLFPYCELGAMPPFGSLFELPTFVDEKIPHKEYIAFSAGTHRDVIHMKTADFLNLEKPILSAFAVPEPVAALA